MRYWAAQAGCVALVLVLRLTPAADYVSLALMALVLAAVQFALVSWRLRGSRSWLWAALAAPLSCLGLSLALMPWVANEVGGDGRGFVAAFALVAWFAVAYVGVGLWAGFQPAPTGQSD